MQVMIDFLTFLPGKYLNSKVNLHHTPHLIPLRYERLIDVKFLFVSIFSDSFVIPYILREAKSSFYFTPAV